MPHLTKSKYGAGLQCLKRLWLQVYQPMPYEAPEEGSTLDIGQKVGVLAQDLFKGGVLVAEEAWEHQKAVARTKELMADKSVPAIYEAAFEYKNIRIRVDILERLPRNRWNICEVKSSSGVKDYHIDDVAIQTFVAKGTGLKINSSDLIYVNKNYVLGKKGLDVNGFFARESLNDRISLKLMEIPKILRRFNKILKLENAPDIEAGSQCSKPYVCEFYDLCNEEGECDCIYNLLKGNSKRKLAELEELGIEKISDIPDDFALTKPQKSIRDAFAYGKIQVSENLKNELAKFEPPVMYLDFEAINPTIPIYVGTRPFQVLPFQWSLHIIDKEGKLTHKEFLASGEEDPREEFAKTLIKAVGKRKIPILVYSSYEKTQLNKLIEAFPDKANEMNDIISRFVDLLPIVKNNVYHPDFNFSFSIKYVAPALCPSFNYEGMDIADGLTASNIFVSMANDLIPTKQLGKTRKDLLAYCKNDTLAMVKVHKALKKLGK